MIDLTKPYTIKEEEKINGKGARIEELGSLLDDKQAGSGNFVCDRCTSPNNPRILLCRMG